MTIGVGAGRAHWRLAAAAAADIPTTCDIYVLQPQPQPHTTHYTTPDLSQRIPAPPSRRSSTLLLPSAQLSPKHSPQWYTLSPPTLLPPSTDTLNPPDRSLQLSIPPPRHPPHHLYLYIRALCVPGHNRSQQGKLDCVAVVEGRACGREAESVCQYCVCSHGGKFFFFFYFLSLYWRFICQGGRGEWERVNVERIRTDSQIGTRVYGIKWKRAGV